MTGPICRVCRNASIYQRGRLTNYSNGLSYPNLNINNVRSLIICKVGGVPCFVLAANGSDKYEIDCPSEITHKIVRLFVSKSILQPHVIFASPYVFQLVMAQQSKQERRDVL